MRTPLITILTLLLPLLFLFPKAEGAIEAHTFDSDLERQRYQSFIEELRCPKCQNQNLAGSDSPISADLRRELYSMITAGKSDKEIVDFMVARYGDFILYRPRVTPATYMLWLLPGGLLLLGLFVMMMILRQRRRAALTQTPQELSEEEQRKLATLLGEHKSNTTARQEQPK